MKILKITLAFTVLSLVFISCNKESTTDTPQDNEKVSLSETANIVTKSLNTNVSENNGSATDLGDSLEFDFCFKFVYPITLAYNNGTEIIVASDQQLLTIIASLTESLYIDRIGFPFRIETMNGQQTISTEGEFLTAISSCDVDADGIPNYLDADDDGDGIIDVDEDLDHNGIETNDDTDGDGIPNYQDSDDDGDGVLTQDEDNDHDGDVTNDDSDGDGVPDYQDTDSDNDGIDDGSDPDADGDGVDDDQEGDDDGGDDDGDNG